MLRLFQPSLYFSCTIVFLPELFQLIEVTGVNKTNASSRVENEHKLLLRQSASCFYSVLLPHHVVAPFIKHTELFPVDGPLNGSMFDYLVTAERS